MMSLRISSLVKWVSVFENPLDVFRYWRVRKLPKSCSAPESFRIRQLGGQPVVCRPGTSDFAVLFDTFHGKYHLPQHPLPPECVIVDLGANIGLTVADFAYKYPRARIVAVEMDSANIKLAFRNTQFCRSRCQLVHAAVWRCEGEIAYGGRAEYAFAVKAVKADEKVPSRRSPARTLDSIFDEYKVKTVDYLKMDIEGTESVVISNEMDWIKRVRCMKIEVHEPATMDGVRNILTSHGFTCSEDVLHRRCVIARR